MKGMRIGYDTKPEKTRRVIERTEKWERTRKTTVGEAITREVSKRTK